MAGLAPASINSSYTFETRMFFMRVVSFPSEKVPAPPSPNCTLDDSKSFPLVKNSLISLVRCSTAWPRSIMIGFSPASAKIRPAYIPLGPNPTIIGLCIGDFVVVGRI